MLTFKWLTFPALSVFQLYEILKLRTAVFVLEQACAYQDVDGLDPQAVHLLGMIDNKLVAYLRLFPPNESEESVVFGRLVIDANYRSHGFGKQLMTALLDYCAEVYPKTPISCEAQHYLQRFYEGFGFQTTSEVFDLDGIPHIHMRK